jgi:hypothetical protein
MNKNAMRKGGSDNESPLGAGAAFDIVSSHGNATATPAPRNNVRREIFVIRDPFN